MQLIKKITVFITAFTSMITLSGMYESVTPVALEAESVLVKETINFYDYWKEKYLVQNPYVTDETQYYVFYGDQTYSEAGYEVEVTVSEAHGYGMLIAASMSDYDNEAKEIFDGMYRYYQSHLSEIGPNLMAWQQNDNGKAIVNSSSGGDSATDGDMDIAYALLMADSIWGSDGEINYKQSAVDVINDIMTYEVNKTDWVLQLGDWVYGSSKNDTYYSATRSSDFIMQYMPVFAEATGDERWLKLYENTYNIINKIVDDYGTGILPDFIIKDSKTGEFIPAPANLLESENDGNYYYNACRTPWRISMDYLINGNEDALKFANAINNFIISKTGGDPWNIMAGYAPDGTTISDWNDLCFDAPFLVSAACDDNVNWHDSVRDMILNYGEDVYFGDTITMLCLIADDGGWVVPESVKMSIPGDVNVDGTFNISDVVMMQKWLLAVPDVKLEDWKAGDLLNDNILNVVDLCLMKHKLIEN
ncbi:MAG: glycosyl hydrolase family 8 [Oscillospiraceae bacterium]|nr:glycosyl hydrolase family 8 [Oscillospiraceae bacterium]